MPATLALLGFVDKSTRGYRQSFPDPDGLVLGLRVARWATISWVGMLAALPWQGFQSGLGFSMDDLDLGEAARTVDLDLPYRHGEPPSPSPGETPLRSEFNPPFEVLEPVDQTVPFVFNSPHSGRHYPDSFLEQSKLDEIEIRRSEDSFVDEVFAAAPAVGAPLLAANFPRAYLDPNREPYELDPTMFADPLPPHANTRSLRVAGGLGTIARVVADAAEIYRAPLPYAEAERRIRELYIPFHDRLRGLLERTHGRFGAAVLIDCHSMPSVGGPMDEDMGSERPHIVLGDRYGTACAPALTDAAEEILTGLGYTVTRNNPYAGGFNTEHYGRPSRGLHALQIEINRALYMDERTVTRTPGLARLSRDMGRFLEELCAQDWTALAPRERPRHAL